MKNYISNQNESVKMFDNRFLEFFTHVHPATPLVIFIPVIIYSSYFAVEKYSMETGIFVLNFIFGIAVWSITEYLLHRFAFHIEPDNKIKKYIYFMIHGVHHDYPNDGSRLVMVPAISIPLAALFYYMFVFVIGNINVTAFFPGFISGYLIYDMMHYAIHHFSMKGKILSEIKKHHFKHHYQSSNKYFGVSSPSWVLFPASPTESNGIEDARFVRFINDDGSYLYYATYTAYDGKVITPQLLETDFKYFKMITLNGNAIQNKGMALFPRKINGKFAMLSRQDGESIFLMYSDNMHFWNDAVRIVKPKYDWEFMQIGNCGSPIETDRGWLVLTHGVGSFRQYSIGAILLDINDPSRIIGRLSEPMLVSSGVLRDGYVPNVVYTCGCLVHKDKLIVPYSYSDLRTTISTVDLPRLLQLLQSGE